ncbi:MAG: hypothetical protein Q8N95_11735 [Desulfobacterales bacterium]|nr:hypothetical protein [Desulfobacterales bacterium]
MLPIFHINNYEAITASQGLPPGRSGFNELFSVSLTDTLLKNTMQYEKWKLIRQNDPSMAGKIAQLVLERHDYVAGKAPATEQYRKHFDHLTEQLKNEGIYLYNSRQFKTPIFQETIGDNTPVITDENKHPETLRPIESSKTLGLRHRFNNRDCYEFLAGILEENGISYFGVNGVGSTLIDQARSRGMNLNAFLTGEGITRVLCDNPVEINVSRVTDTSFDEIWNKIEPHLKKGAILSFSSQPSGHTGIIDQKNGQWVYINSSGVPYDRKTYRVIEEDLKHEIRGRLERANRQQTFLSITLGSLSRVLTARFENSPLSEGRGLKEIDLFQVT